ncbi:MAG: leucyl aminopeptidase [Candidatus Heimdallarchaeota archaeon]|nr:leucyl aminopeptidase [Candidatus Heimdallarchaeota archaeon]
MNVDFKKIQINEFNIPLVLVGVLEEAKGDVFISDINEEAGNVVELGDFKGKNGDLSLIYTKGTISPKRLLLIGLGKQEKLTVETVRKVVGNASRKARDLDVKKLGIYLDSFARDKLELTETTEALVQGIIMGSFQNIAYRTKNLEKYKKIEELIIFSPDTDEIVLKQGVESGKIIADAVNFCRELAWGPANYITPTKLANEALRLEKDLGIKTTVFEREQAKEIGLTSFLAVAQGTKEPPKFIIMEHGADKEGVETVALIGKAITFDSGGISIKPGQNMEKMKADMTGGAVVVAVMEAVAKLDLDLHIVGIVPATDNMPSGTAYHPGDIITSYSGITIEVINTDAEGRMILNDALTYAAKHYKPKAMFDFATLTGAMMIALGEHAIGYFSNHDFVVDKLEEASNTSGERVWRMPLWEVYDEQLKSDVADFKHTGGRPGGSITAARFLSQFTLDVPWAHLDIAGAMEQSSDKHYNPKGSKGPAVRVILDVLRNW